MPVLLTIMLFFCLGATGQGFSETPQKYKYQVTLKTNNTWTFTNRYRLIGSDGTTWFVEDHFWKNCLEDSVVKQRSGSALKIYEFIIQKLDSLKSDEEIKKPCSKNVNEIFEGKEVVLITDFMSFHDYPYYTMEISAPGIKKIVTQMDPITAMEICPENRERRLFRELIEMFQKVHF